MFAPALPSSMGVHYSIKLSGDVRLVKELPRVIPHAAKQTIIEILPEAQTAVIIEIKNDFVVRGSWYEPSRRTGIHVRFTRNPEDLTGRLETYADWLLEHETGEDKVPDKHQGHLTVPQVGAARPSLPSVVPTLNKARRILPNVSELATRRLQLTAGRPSTSKGKRGPKFKDTPFFMNRAGTAIFERLPDRRLRLFYTLTATSHIKKQSTVIEPTVRTVDLRFQPIFDKRLKETVEFRRGK